MTFFRSAIYLLLFFFSLSCQQDKAPEQRPNILFAISDDQSFAHTSFAGSKFVETPAFDRVAREGIYFRNCYAGSPGCAPSRSSIVTGRYHWQNEQSGQHASSWLKKYIPFLDLIGANGYAVGRTGKGVAPFKYARGDQDSLWRKENAGGLVHKNLVYEEEGNELFANEINRINYAENFRFFMDSIRKDQPFFFWFGAYEPHRAYEKGSWKRRGKKLADAEVPAFLPDTDEIRGDLLDYAVEIEWFDLHLQRMLAYLEDIGELENTIVIVTSDNGMPFPRAKANCYEYGAHVPMAIRYPKDFPGSRTVETPVSFIELAPTILEITGTSAEGMMPITGKSLLSLLEAEQESEVSEKDKAVFSGRERHSSSRYQNWGYPQRAVRQGDYLFVWNMKPDRWPSGAPQRFDPEDTTRLLPMYGLSADHKYLPDGAFTDIDDAPSKTFLIENYNVDSIQPYFNLTHAKRPEYELYNVVEDPFCLNNLSGVPSAQAVEKQLKDRLIVELRQSGDPRVVGVNPEIFDTYKRYSKIRQFPHPDASGE